MSKRAAGGRKGGPNVAHILFATHLNELKCTFWQEWDVVRGHKFKWDFVFVPHGKAWDMKREGWAVEIDGYHNGRHGAGWGSDNEKMNLATVNGWRFLRFSTNQVKDGTAKSFIAEHLLGQKGREG